MKILKFILKSFFIGLVLSGILYIIAYPILVIYNSVEGKFNIYYVSIILAIVFIIGALTNVIYLQPLNFFAKHFLKTLASFYNEFFKQSSVYFTKENTTKPFESVVEVKITSDIKLLGLLTNKKGDNSYTVFIPTSPRPSSGITMIVTGDVLTFTTIDPKDFMKYVMTSGAYNL